MDRQSFITNRYLNENSPGVCGPDDCECYESRMGSETQVLKQKPSFGFAALSVMAFLSTIFFAGYKINAAKIESDQWLIAKKKTVVSCSPYRAFNRSDKKFNDHRSINNKDPADKNNGNGCTHQQGTNSLCETTNSKRKVFKIHTC